SGLKATLVTEPIYCWIVTTPRPVPTSQILTVPPSLPKASRAPSGLKARLVTGSVCSSRVRMFFPVAASQTLTLEWLTLPVESVPPDAIRLPSGLKATLSRFCGELAQWKVTAPENGDPWTIAFGSGSDFPQVAALHPRSGYFRLVSGTT